MDLQSTQGQSRLSGHCTFSGEAPRPLGRLAALAPQHLAEVSTPRGLVSGSFAVIWGSPPGFSPNFSQTRITCFRTSSIMHGTRPPDNKITVSVTLYSITQSGYLKPIMK